jgi:hypothetical protein
LLRGHFHHFHRRGENRRDRARRKAARIGAKRSAAERSCGRNTADCGRVDTGRAPDQTAWTRPKGAPFTQPRASPWVAQCANGLRFGSCVIGPTGQPFASGVVRRRIVGPLGRTLTELRRPISQGDALGWANEGPSARKKSIQHAASGSGSCVGSKGVGELLFMRRCWIGEGVFGTIEDI